MTHTITEPEIRQAIIDLQPIVLAQSARAGRPGTPSVWKTLYYRPTYDDKYLVVKDRDTEVIRTAVLHKAIEEYNKI